MSTGGVIAPDGRKPQAPGVGPEAKRHDLEGTPGLDDPSIQPGDVQRLEAGQHALKQVQAPATAEQPPQAQGTGEAIEVPDAIDFAGDKLGGQIVSPGDGVGQAFDPTPWIPTMRAMAEQPNAGGILAAQVVNMIASHRRQPGGAQQTFIDLNAADDILEG